MNKRVGTVIGWTCTILVSLSFLMAAIMKFVPIAPGSAGEQMVQSMGLAGLQYPLGILQFIILALFLIPRTSTVGFVLIIGYMGGALATNLTHAVPQADIVPIYITFVVLAISAWFRNPELTARLRGK